MDMPLLWTDFSACPSRNISPSQYMQMMTLFLDLSRHYPLTFDNCGETYDEQRNFIKSFPLFLSEINRWHDVSIELDMELCRQLLATPIGNEPLLGALTLSIDQCSYEIACQLPAIISKFTHLRKLHLIEDSTYMPLQGMPWAQLTVILIEVYLPMDECVDILNECSSLVDCSLMNLCAPAGPIKPCDIVLPSLAVLHLLAESDVGSILSCMTCPALAELYIDYEWYLVARDPSTLVNFLFRSSCKLQIFSLYDDGATEDEIISYIRTPALQSVVALSLEGFGPSIRTLTFLKHPEDKNAPVTFMPFLEMLALHVEGVPDELVSDVVASRFKVAARSTSGQRLGSLRWVEVAFRRRNCERTEEDKRAIGTEHLFDLSKFEGFRQNGLRITVHMGR